MSLDLSGQVALVTGAAKRLGRALALRLAQHGAFVFVHYKNSQAAAEAVVSEIKGAGGDAIVLQGDLTSAESPYRMMATIAEQKSRLDVLINNVGNYMLTPVEESTPEEWRETLEANLIAPFALVREGLSLFPSQGGNIVNIGYAGVELIRANVNATAYQASKTGLLVLTKSLAQRFGSRGLRVNMLSPGQLENSVDLPAPNTIDDVIPLGRAGRLFEIADAMDFVLANDYITGTNIDIAGGYLPPRD
ncbi:MAG: SDR family oxidoreductase [Planctomycetota bacterium]